MHYVKTCSWQSWPLHQHRGSISAREKAVSKDFEVQKVNTWNGHSWYILDPNRPHHSLVLQHHLALGACHMLNQYPEFICVIESCQGAFDTFFQMLQHYRLRHNHPTPRMAEDTPLIHAIFQHENVRKGRKARWNVATSSGGSVVASSSSRASYGSRTEFSGRRDGVPRFQPFNHDVSLYTHQPLHWTVFVWNNLS